MTRRSVFVALLACALMSAADPFHTPAWATSLAGTDAQPVTLPQDDVVLAYLSKCRAKPATASDCAKLKRDADELLKEDLRTLGSSANRAYLPTILTIFKSDEPALRIAAADAIGMIGPEEEDAALLAPLANDPVPDVRLAVSQMLQRGKGPSFLILTRRLTAMKSGTTPETAPDPAKLALPLPPGSSYLFSASSVELGRLSYVTKDKAAAAAFFKGKAKQGPLTLEAFRDKYRYQLQDEETAREQAVEELNKQLASGLSDPKKMERLQPEIASRNAMAMNDTYPPELFKGPTVYVLEERRIGERTYPTRYVVVYDDLAFKKPGFRIAWLTAPESSIKAAQAVTLQEEKQQKTEQEKEAAQEKKDEARKKSFKQEQSDLEKELGF